MLVNIIQLNAEKPESLKEQTEQAAEEQTYEETEDNNEKPLQVEVGAKSHWIRKKEWANHRTIDNQTGINKKATHKKASGQRIALDAFELFNLRRQKRNAPNSNVSNQQTNQAWNKSTDKPQNQW